MPHQNRTTRTTTDDNETPRRSRERRRVHMSACTHAPQAQPKFASPRVRHGRRWTAAACDRERRARAEPRGAERSWERLAASTAICIVCV
jgi:hypothetical protein